MFVSEIEEDVPEDDASWPRNTQKSFHLDIWAATESGRGRRTETAYRIANDVHSENSQHFVANRGVCGWWWCVVTFFLWECELNLYLSEIRATEIAQLISQKQSFVDSDYVVNILFIYTYMNAGFFFIVCNGYSYYF